MTQSEQCYWINGTKSLPWRRVDTNIQFVLKKKKIAISVKYYKAKHNKMRHVCVIMSYEVHKQKLSSEW